jgi:hypothetical protein
LELSELGVGEKWEETEQNKINNQKEKNMFEIILRANANKWLKLRFFKEKKK